MSRLAVVVLIVMFPALVTGCRSEEGAVAEIEGLPLWPVARELRIGAVDDPDYAFPAVTAVIVGPDESIYTLHRQDGQVRLWSADGLPAGAVGGTGEGPGEFTRPSAMGWHRDSIWVFDLGNYRISFFDGNGVFMGNLVPRVDLGTQELAMQGINPPRPQGYLQDGSVHGVPPAFDHDVVTGSLTELVHVRMDERGVVLDTLAVVPVGKESVLGILRDGGGGTFTSQPFGDATLVVVTSDGSGMLLLDRRAAHEPGMAEFRVTRVDLAGDTVWSRGYAYPPVPLPKSQVDEAIQERAERIHEFVGEPTGTTLAQWRGWVAEAIYAPPYYTPVSGIGAGRYGTVWLALNPPGPEGPEWFITTEGGEPLGRVRMPEGFRWMTADGSRLWGVETDALDVEYIVRYRIVNP